MKKLLTLILILFQWHCHALIDWGAPTTISTPGVNASAPQGVTDANGNATAVWVENGVIKTSSMRSGGNWSAISSLSNTLNSSSDPLLGIDGSGNVTAVWVENGIVMTSTLPLDGSWSLETALSDPSGGASAPSLCVDNLGNKAAAWVRNSFIESAQYPASVGSWSSATKISTNGAEDNPNIYIGSDGTIAAVWHSVVSGSDLVYSAIGTVNGSWSSPMAIVPSTQTSAHHNYPKVVVDSSGNAKAIWYSYMIDETNYYDVAVLASSLPSSATEWVSPSSILSGAGMYNPRYLCLRLAIDPDDNVIAIWINSYDGTTFAVETGMLPDRGSWQSPNSIVLNNIYAYQVDIAATSLGTCIASFMYYDGVNLDIQTAETSINGVLYNFWSTPVSISEGAANDGPSISAQFQSSSNMIYGASLWINYNGVNNVINASIGSGSGVLPPTNVQVVQNSNNLGVFTEYYNTITWTESSDPNVIQYILYRNGVAFQTAIPGTTQFIDHNAFQSQAVIYGVAAVGQAHILSQIVTASLP